MSNLIYTQLATAGANAPVNLDLVSQVSKIGSAFQGSDGNPSLAANRFGILFTFTAHGQNVQSVTWNYDTESDRDDDFDAIIAFAAVDINNPPVVEP